MADLPNLLIFLVPYMLGIIYLKCWHNFLKHEDPDHAPELAANVGRQEAQRPQPGNHTLSHGHA